MGFLGDAWNTVKDNFGTPGPPSATPPAGSTRTNSDGSKSVANADGTITTTYPDGRTSTDRPTSGGIRGAIGDIPIIGGIADYVDPQIDKTKQAAAAAAAKAVDDFNKSMVAPTPTVAPKIGGVDAAVEKQRQAQAAVDAAQVRAQQAEDAYRAAVEAAKGRPYNPNDPLTVAAANASAAAGAARGQVTGYVAALNTANNELAAARASDPTGGRNLNATAAGPVGVATYQAPQVTNVSTYTPQQATAPGFVSAGSVTPQQVAAGVVSTPGAIYADQIAMPGQVRAGQMVAGQIGIGDAGTAGARDIEATLAKRQLFDAGQSDQSREIFQRALALAEGAATGSAPSEAEALARKMIDEGAGAAHGLAASIQGRNPGLAMRQGQIAGNTLIAKGAADLAALKAREIATGREQMGQFAGAIRAGDIQQSTAQLSADTEIEKTNVDNLLKAAQSNQSTELGASIANLNARVEILKANLEAATRAGEVNATNDLNAQIANLNGAIEVAKTNATNSLQARIQTVSNEIKVAEGNRDAALKAGEINTANDLQAQISKMTADLEAAKANQSMLTDLNKFNATQINDAGKFTAEQLNDISKFNATKLADAGQFNAGETNTMGRYNTSQENDMSKFNAGQNIDITKTNIDADLRQQAINDLRAQGFRDDQIQLILAKMGFATDAANRDAAGVAGQRAQILGTLGTIGSAYLTGGASGMAPKKPLPTTQYGPNGAPILD